MSGTWAGTLVVQRSRTGKASVAADWFDVESFTANAERDSRNVGSWYWRIGFKTGGYTSGTAVVNVY
jgi:hypothetical protein